MNFFSAHANSSVEELRKLDVFSDLTFREALEMDELLHERVYEKGEIIFEEGDIGHGIFLHIHPLLSVLMFFLGATVAGGTGLVLTLPVLGVVAVVGEIVAQVVMDRRLRFRYRAAREFADRSARSQPPGLGLSPMGEA